ncbi:hypothetical protein [Kitasatospora sp. NBC_00458]|uniref:hypothetical protein n=1 Tax=Kitasatospora sp. NBC_00458 TaxID=2903568 RepID=UPI002E178499
MTEDPTLFAQTAGTTLVALLTTGAFQHAKQAVLDLWHRMSPDEAAAVDHQLEATRTALMRAEEEGDEDRERELAGWWQERLTLLFATDPSTIGTLHRALTQAAPESSRTRTGGIRLTARANGNAHVFQAGRDQHIIGH